MEKMGGLMGGRGRVLRRNEQPTGRLVHCSHHYLKSLFTPLFKIYTPLYLYFTNIREACIDAFFVRAEKDLEQETCICSRIFVNIYIWACSLHLLLSFFINGDVGCLNQLAFQLITQDCYAAQLITYNHIRF